MYLLVSCNVAFEYNKIYLPSHSVQIWKVDSTLLLFICQLQSYLQILQVVTNDYCVNPIYVPLF